MRQETPTTVIEVQTPFDRDGNFITAKARDLALEQRALGDLDGADALDQLIDFFITSQNYIFNGAVTFEQEIGATAVPVIYPGAAI